MRTKRQIINNQNLHAPNMERGESIKGVYPWRPGKSPTTVTMLTYIVNHYDKFEHAEGFGSGMSGSLRGGSFNLPSVRTKVRFRPRTANEKEL